MPGIALSSDSIDNPNVLATVIKEILNASDADTTDITVHAGEYHEDWSADKPCPNCGSETFSVMCANSELYEVDENGRLVYIEQGDSLGPKLSYFCWNCEETIQEVPYEELL